MARRPWVCCHGAPSVGVFPAWLRLKHGFFRVILWRTGNRKYIKCVYLYNKIDTVTIEEVDEIARKPKSVVCSVHEKYVCPRVCGGALSAALLCVCGTGRDSR